MGGTLDKIPSSVQKRFSKILNLTGKTPVETKTALDEFLTKGWILVTIYPSGNQVRACLVRTVE